jgi:Mg2+ and Co2+ transporter CorA
MIPTVIAFYGMNVPNSLQNSMGLLIVIIISILFFVLEYSYSKEKDGFKIK